VVGHDRGVVTPAQGPPTVGLLAERLGELGWVTELLVAGSLATGDYVPGVSDLDLVALTQGPVGRARQEILAGLHRELDQGAAQGLDLGYVYVDSGRLTDLGALHPTWTHGSLVQRSLSVVTGGETIAVVPRTTTREINRYKAYATPQPRRPR